MQRANDVMTGEAYGTALCMDGRFNETDVRIVALKDTKHVLKLATTYGAMQKRGVFINVAASQAQPRF